MFHGSSFYSFLENDLNAITRQKFAKSVNRESRSRNIIDGSFELPSSRCMHDPSFMSLAFIVLGKMTSTQKLDKSLHRRRRRRQYREDNPDSMLTLGQRWHKVSPLARRGH